MVKELQMVSSSHLHQRKIVKSKWQYTVKSTAVNEQIGKDKSIERPTEQALIIYIATKNEILP